MKKVEVKALFTMTVVRQIVIADVLYRLACDTYEVCRDEEVGKIRDMAMRYVRLMSTYMNNRTDRAMLQAAITERVEILTSEAFNTAMEATSFVLRNHDVEHPEAGAHIFALEALSSGSAGALDCVSKEIRQLSKLSITLKSIRPIALSQKARKLKSRLLRGCTHATEKELELITSAMVAYTNLLLSEETITRSIQEAHEMIKEK